MPDLHGLDKDESSETMEESGIDDYTVEWHEGENPLVVVDQVPDAGETIDDETEVRIVLSGR